MTEEMKDIETIPECKSDNFDHLKDAIKLVKKSINGLDGYDLIINEPWVINKSEKKLLSSSYHFYKKYYYDYFVVLYRYLEAQMSHFKTDKYSRN